MIKLSRLAIVKHLNLTTPLCVIVEVGEAHGLLIDRSKLNDIQYVACIAWTVTNSECLSVSSQLDQRSEQRSVARFINSDSSVTWSSLNGLKQAWAFLLKYMTHSPVPFPTEFRIGQQTQDYPESLNFSVLYRLCQDNGIKTSYDSTPAQMASALQLSTLPPERLLSNLMTRLKERQTNRLAIINALVDYESAPPISQVEVTHKQLEEGAKKFKGDPILLLNPSSKVDAIYLAAFHFGIDLTAAHDPILEYDVIRSIDDPSRYFPLDPGLLELYKANHRSIFLDFTFNPRLPESYYTKARLISLFNFEGFMASQAITGYYYSLQTAYLSETFYHGLHPGLSEKTTDIEMLDIYSISLKEIILYGIREQKLKAYTCAELISCFKHSQALIAPSGKTVISPEACRKLINIANNIKTADAKALIELVKKLERQMSKMDPLEAKLYTEWETSPGSIKEIISGSLYSLLELAMYMRGWDGKGPYPISKAPTPGYDGLSQLAIDMQVTRALAEFEAITDKLEKPTIIYSLPLFKLVQNTYQPVLSNGQQQTIRQRIEIIKNPADDVASCIRLSSNLFAATAHRYLTTLGLDPRFKLDTLIAIS